MNLREGTRRLALLLGVVGAILGGFFSYFQLQSTLKERAAHIRFEKLANSSVVIQARIDCFPTPKGAEIEGGKFVPPFCAISIDDPHAFFYRPSESNSNGMKTVHFENREITSIETQDGQTLYPTPAPSAWLYLLIALFPILGFFIPWGAVRAIGWVGGGFVAGPK
jgi:hypothetical protein